MSETSARPPELSVIIAALDQYETIRNAVHQLNASRIKDKMEILFVVRDASFFNLEETDLDNFHSFHLIELPNLRSSGQARAAAIAQAGAPLIAFVEEHTIPDPNWADALVEAHKKPCAATAPVLINANPETAISWAEIYLDFGPWVTPAPGGFVSGLPWHNTSYKKAILDSYGSSLADVLEAEIWIQWDLLAQGQKLYLEPLAKTQHLNHSRLSPYVSSCYFGGRLFGAKRALYGKWSAFRRIAYTGGAFLIPLVRLPRILKLILRGQRPLLLKIFPALLIGLFVHAAGEGVGYALGAGRSAEKRCDYELRRRCFLGRTDPQARNCK